MKEKNFWEWGATYLNRCPSPHNTQPFKLKVLSDSNADVIFYPRRGLYVGDPSGRFTWLTAGIFVEICSILAHNQGYELQTDYNYQPMYSGNDYSTPQIIAHLKIKPAQNKIEDFDPQLILDRHTSRLPYDGKPVDTKVINEMQQEASRLGHTFEVRNDPTSIKWVVELNKQALFHDMDNDDIRRELIGWLRFNEREAKLKGDGLSAKCLQMPGRLLRSFFLNHKFWTLPIVRQIVGMVYKSTMKGIGTIGYLRGNYVSIEDWVGSGKVMFRLWLIVTKYGYYWHPYGSVITSEDARKNMIDYLKLGDEDGGKQMVWLLLRLGKSEPPPVSERLPVEEVIL